MSGSSVVLVEGTKAWQCLSQSSQISLKYGDDNIAFSQLTYSADNCFGSLFKYSNTSKLYSVKLCVSFAYTFSHGHIFLIKLF